MGVETERCHELENVEHRVRPLPPVHRDVEQVALQHLGRLEHACELEHAHQPDDAEEHRWALSGIAARAARVRRRRRGRRRRRRRALRAQRVVKGKGEHPEGEDGEGVDDKPALEVCAADRAPVGDPMPAAIERLLVDRVEDESAVDGEDEIYEPVDEPEGGDVAILLHEDDLNRRHDRRKQ